MSAIWLLFDVLSWLLVAFFCIQVAMFIGLVMWIIWTDSIKPRLVPIAEIDRVADEIIRNFSDPDEAALAHHQRAWHRSDGAEQTHWRRVRKAVRKRLRG